MTPQPYVPTTPIIIQPTTSSGQRHALLGQDIEAEIASHVHHPSKTPNLSLPPVEPTRQLSSSPNLSPAKRRRSGVDESCRSPILGLALDIGSSMRSASSMQTPPPTSKSANRRKAQQAQVAILVQQSAAAGRRMSAPMFPKQSSMDSSVMHAEPSSHQFSTFEFSPEVFEFSMSGPATAPAFPQQRLFWDPKQDEGMNMDFSSEYPDPFDTPRQPPLNPYVSSHDHASTLEHPTSTSFLDFREDEGHPTSMSIVSSCFGQPSFVTTAGSVNDNQNRLKPSSDSVNPNLLFSSPGRAVEPLGGPIVSKLTIDKDSLQPYAYQIQEAKREKALESVGKPKKKRKPDSDSPAVKAAIETLRGEEIGRTNIRRRFTDSASLSSNKESKYVSGSSVTHSRVTSSSIRRSSPVKEPQKSPNHRPLCRTALALTIDSAGRARTEARAVVTSKPAGRDAMSDSDTSSVESYEIMSTSQNPSFSFADEGPQRSKSNHFRANSGSHSSQSSHSSVQTSSSFAVGLHPVADRKGFKDIAEDSPSDAETIVESEDGDGTAQHELRKLLMDRQDTRRSNRAALAKSKKHSYSPLGTSAAWHNGGGNASASNMQDFSGTSPTTISDPDLAYQGIITTGTTSNSIRCVCHNNVDDGQMIAW
ncbi:hypothetical protein MMC19_002434 [Ptychographa xylographoides]|nr:hypothetical protein [Ptychographa xylographoides]